MSEIAVVSSRKVKLESAAKKGSIAARRALDLMNSPNKFLSTVQIGITLIGILLGVFGGESLIIQLDTYLQPLPYIGPYSHPVSVSLVLMMITFLSLILGELVPKRIGLNHPEAIAKAVAMPMIVISRLAAPFVWLLTTTTELLLRILNIKPSADSKITEEEIKAIMQEGTEGGEIQEIEHDIVKRVFYLGDRKVSSLMTYRGDLVWLDDHDSSEVIKQKISNEVHSVYLVCSGSLESPKGVVFLTDLFKESLAGREIDLAGCLQPIHFIPENSSAYKALERFKETKVHYGVVADEYGVIQGIVTLDDLVDALVGDVSTDYFTEPQIVQREDGTWLIDAQYSYHDFLRFFDLIEIVEDQEFNTIAGMILEHLGYIPKTGERLIWQKFDFEIIDMDGARIDKILVKLTE